MDLNFYCQVLGNSKGKPLLYFGGKKQSHVNVVVLQVASGMREG